MRTLHRSDLARGIRSAWKPDSAFTDQTSTRRPRRSKLACRGPSRNRAAAAESARAGSPGADSLLGRLEPGPPRRRVGLRPEGRAPVRAGAPLYAEKDASAPVGFVTSGGFGPSLDAPIAIGYLPAALSVPGMRIF